MNQLPLGRTSKAWSKRTWVLIAIALGVILMFPWGLLRHIH
jgi:hypothetical protein